MCAFVNSAFNIEFVYLILLGINNFMDNRQLLYDRKMEQQGLVRIDTLQRHKVKKSTKIQRSIQIVKGKSQTKIKFVDIDFNDVELWDVKRKQSTIGNDLDDDYDEETPGNLDA
jgi:heme exporter protein D